METLLCHLTSIRRLHWWQCLCHGKYKLRILQKSIVFPAGSTGCKMVLFLSEFTIFSHVLFASINVFKFPCYLSENRSYVGSIGAVPAARLGICVTEGSCEMLVGSAASAISTVYSSCFDLFVGKSWILCGKCLWVIHADMLASGSARDWKWEFRPVFSQDCLWLVVDEWNGKI